MPASPRRALRQAARARIRELTDRRRLWLPPEEIVADLNRFLRGWGGYFRYGNSTRWFDRIDRFSFDRVARFLGEKHKRHPPLNEGRALLARQRDLIPRRLGTVGWKAVPYRPVHATR